MMSKIVDLFRSPAVPQRTKRWATKELDKIQKKMDIIRRKDGYNHFLLDYIQKERRKFQNGEREEPMCGCDLAACDLKKGKLPREVKKSAIGEGIRRFQQNHRGHPTILTEAQNEFLEARKEVFKTLREVLSRMSNDRGGGGEPEVPEPDTDTMEELDEEMQSIDEELEEDIEMEAD